MSSSNGGVSTEGNSFLPVNKKEKDELETLATYSDVFTAFGNTSKVRTCRIIGVFFAAAAGLCYPAMVFFFAKVFEDIGSPSSAETFMEDVRQIVFSFLILGVVGFVAILLQSSLMELAAAEATLDFKKKWFEALLRQDMAYFDIKDVSAQATIVSANAVKFKKGIGRKLAEGIQFFFTTVGGIGYGFYASWRVSLLILAVVPFMGGSGYFLLKATTTETERAIKNYEQTGGIVYSAISAIRTVFALNACDPMIKKFEESTQKAYKSACESTIMIGLGNGFMMASFLLSYAVLTLYGSYQLYDEVRNTGCDPSNTLTRGDPTVETCSVTAAEVFGALFGITIGAMGLAQISAAVEAINGSRAACHPALLAINRNVNEDVTVEDNEETMDIEENIDQTGGKRKDIPLPRYVIDSASTDGKMPSEVSGEIAFKGVSFKYPTRAEKLVFNGLDLTCEAGKTIALVGPSGSGKSTVVSLMERFYDPTSGSISIDGHDLRDLNVHWLRDQIGLVAQEPSLFACSIKENISYGCSGATDEQIKRVAELANAHDFISSFPQGYDTEVGDKGAQLSGGQKQRIAIARVLLKNPKILLLDEATSALDTESESLVQKAMDDHLLGTGGRTTIVIAHRLSTIRNADMIAVVKDGRIVERGTHDKLMSTNGSEYAKLVEAQAPPKPETTNIISIVASSFKSNFKPNTVDITSPQLEFSNVHFAYPTRPGINIFKRLNLKVKKGETLAIVGPSGGGKSTVIQMIERFYDPINGAITLDGEDLKELNVKWLRDQLGLVSQEPVLFNTTIGENIKAGYPEGSQVEIEEAARQANAHDFIMSFPNGYDTDVGEAGTQVSGGQKQRIAIARAIIKKPKILLLDEATSALDSESERVVQTAIDNLMVDKSQTIIVIAHRLSTIQNADRIAVIADGVMKETGTHNELMALSNGHYKRLNHFHSNSSTKAKLEPKKTHIDAEDEKQDIAEEEDIGTESATESATESIKRARMLAKDDIFYICIGAIGAILAGVVFPAWGFVFAYMVEVLYEPVPPCGDTQRVLFNDSCEEYWNFTADNMRDKSINVTYGWLGVLASTIIGNALLYYGFGVAMERMNKRVRDSVFTALMKQEVAYFDQNSIGNMASRIEEDAAMIHSFSGQPVRSFVMSLASVLLGVFLSFYYLWPFALMTLAVLPFLGFGAMMEMKMYMGEDDGSEAQDDSESGPGAIVVETLLNIRAVASLTIENKRFQEYSQALERDNSTSLVTNALKGGAIGLGFILQMWGMGFMFWWGAFLLYKWPGRWEIGDFLISMFSLLFSLSGMTMAMAGATDKVKATMAANRIFSLINRESAINALSDEGLHGSKKKS